MKLSQLPVLQPLTTDNVLALRGTSDILVNAAALAGLTNQIPVANQTLATISTQYPAASYTGFYALSSDQGLIASNGVRWYPLIPTINVVSLGADPTGVQDSTAAFATALAAAGAATYGGVVSVPTGIYSLSSGITVPGKVTLQGTAFSGQNPGSGAANAAGTILLFALSVGTCVTLGGPADTSNTAANLFRISVLRKSGTPPDGSIGVLVQNGYMNTIEDVLSVSHQVCFQCQGPQGSVGSSEGITTWVNRLFTGAAHDSHIVIDTMPEVRFNQCRFGMNGSGDQNCNSYIRIQGGNTSNASTGPNTLVWENCQFNQGGSTTGTTWVSFANQTVGAVSERDYYVFHNCYVEDNVNGITSDSTWTYLSRVFISDVNFNVATSTLNFLNLNAATQINDWQVDNCFINCQVQFSSAAGMSGWRMSNCFIKGAASFVGTNPSHITFTNNEFYGGLSVTGTFQVNSYISGGTVIGSLTFTASGIGLDVAPYNTGVNFTPQLQFGGANVGMTGTFTGRYTLQGRQVYFEYGIVLTALGSSTGNATLINLPFVAQNAVDVRGGGVVTAAANLSGLTAGMNLEMAEGGLSGNFKFPTTTGTTVATNANFTNTSVVYGNATYLI